MKSITRIWNLFEMMPFDASEFFKFAKIIGNEQSSIGHTQHEMYGITENQFTSFVSGAEKIFDYCQKMELSSSMASTRRLLDLLKDIKDNHEFVSNIGSLSPSSDINPRMTRLLGLNIRELEGRLTDELEARKFLSLSPYEETLFQPVAPPWGIQFQDKFPNATYDLDEAGKCLALGRSTAAVFHLMRVLELGLRAVSSTLQGPPILEGNDKNWSSILKNIRDAKSAKGKWNGMQFFNEVYAKLDSVKGAWRNPTMHIEKKYTPEEAQEIFTTVKIFMKQISSRMDEQGLPLE